MQLHLPGDPGAVEVGVPPSLLLIGRLLVLVAGPDERDAEVALLPVHGHLVLPGRDGRSRVLLGCDWTEGHRVSGSRGTATNQEPGLHAGVGSVHREGGEDLPGNSPHLHITSPLSRVNEPGMRSPVYLIEVNY